jgi:hypothetical protein
MMSGGLRVMRSLAFDVLFPAKLLRNTASGMTCSTRLLTSSGGSVVLRAPGCFARKVGSIEHHRHQYPPACRLTRARDATVRPIADIGSRIIRFTLRRPSVAETVFGL